MVQGERVGTPPAQEQIRVGFDRFLAKSSMALGGFEFTPELGLAGGGREVARSKRSHSVNGKPKQVMRSPILVRPC